MVGQTGARRESCGRAVLYPVAATNDAATPDLLPGVDLATEEQWRVIESEPLSVVDMRTPDELGCQRNPDVCQGESDGLFVITPEAVAGTE